MLWYFPAQSEDGVAIRESTYESITLIQGARM